MLCKFENCCHKTFNQIKAKNTIRSNYWPVSNLRFISRTVEKCALQQFNKQCNGYDILSKHQSAYRKYYSCETGLLNLINDILWNMENKLVSAVTILKISATFDTVDHNLLPYVLHNKFGIDGNALKWYNNYLKPRKCKVNINRTYSKNTCNSAYPRDQFMEHFYSQHMPQHFVKENRLHSTWFCRQSFT